MSNHKQQAGPHSQRGCATLLIPIPPPHPSLPGCFFFEEEERVFHSRKRTSLSSPRRRQPPLPGPAAPSHLRPTFHGQSAPVRPIGRTASTRRRARTLSWCSYGTRTSTLSTLCSSRAVKIILTRACPPARGASTLVVTLVSPRYGDVKLLEPILVSFSWQNGLQWSSSYKHLIPAPPVVRTKTLRGIAEGAVCRVRAITSSPSTDLSWRGFGVCGGR